MYTSNSSTMFPLPLVTSNSNIIRAQETLDKDVHPNVTSSTITSLEARPLWSYLNLEASRLWSSLNKQIVN